MSALPTETGLKAHMTEGLTLAYVRKLERQRDRALALLFFLSVLSFVWLLFRFDGGAGQDGPALFSDSMGALTSFLSAYWVLQVAYQASRPPVVLARRYRLASLLVGLAFLMNGLGNLYYIYYQYVFKQEPPTPSYGDIGFTLAYILGLAGLLLLPGRLKSRRPAPYVLIDVLIALICLFGISWYFLINPLLNQYQPGAFFQTFVGVSYLCWDTLLILVLILFVHLRTDAIFRPSVLIGSLGILVELWGDASYAYVSSSGHYQSGMAWIDPFWFIGYLLIAFAFLYQYSAIVRQSYTQNVLAAHTANKSKPAQVSSTFEYRFVFLQSLMIYGPFIMLISLTLYSQFRPGTSAMHFLDILCAVVFVLVVAHYILATLDNMRLVQEKEQSRAEADLLRKSTASLSSVLEMDLLLNHIVTIGATELGFDAVALILIDEYDRPLNEQSSLLARAVTSGGAPVMSWRVSGQKVPSCLAQLGKVSEFFWSSAQAHVPTPVHQWHKEQRIQASLFALLIYQGKVQGCLAFSLRAARQFTPHEHYLVQAFAEEAAKAIEHAHLYELAQENALFAQAMSNVAARLNSVIATGMGMGNEIHHLICTEGANALRADLAILYVYQPDGQFLPQAAVVGETEPQTFPQEWPPISAYDYHTLLLNSSRPALLQIGRSTGLRTELNSHARAIRDLEEWKLSTGQHPAISSRLPTFQVTPGASRFLPVPFRSTRAALVRVNSNLNPVPRHFLTLQEALQRRCVSAAILAPLIVHQTPMGLLVLARTHRPGCQEKRAFARQDLVPAQDFAGQASIAFTNARLYHQLHTAHRRMQELDKLKDQFMVTASHELRTPLTAVQGYLELLAHYQGSLSLEQQQEFLEKASRGCDELVLLLNNVMDVSRLEIEAGIRAAHLERVSVREVVESVVDLILLQAAQENRDLQITIPAHLQVKADPTRLRQVVRNLSVNALKYSPPGTPLLFSARPVFTQKPSVILRVTDRGKGIRPQDQAKLFQRFVRLESDLNSTVRGSGLGLYISRRLVEAMNGRIWVESTGIPGSGSTFCIQLPMA
jgi:signal transduction histidine kinase